MIGLPGQTYSSAIKSMEILLSHKPEHISLYSLIIEEGTKLERKLKLGKLYLPEENEERKMYWNIKNMLEKNGYNHYEISNFAKPGFESKHNIDCWKQKEYIRFWSGSTFLYKFSTLFK